MCHYYGLSYFEWLCERVHANDGDGVTTYSKLLEKLHCTEFTYFFENDGNRAADGLELRKDFAVEVVDPFCGVGLNSPCSVLEMMIALCERIDFSLSEVNDEGDCTALYFWEIIQNLGLDKYDDKNYRGPRVDKILQKLMERTYDSKGKGSMFPVKKSTLDMRNASIWGQMNAYLNEKY